MYRLTGLGDLPGGVYKSRANGINSSGQIVGYSLSGNGNEAFIWDPLYGMVGLGDLTGGEFYSWAESINDSGIVTGTGKSSNGNEAFMWDTINGMVGLDDLPGGVFSSQAFDINNLDQVAGFGNSLNGKEAFVWDRVNGMVGLGDLSGSGFESDAKAMNDVGQIVGNGYSLNGYEAFIWDPVNGMVGLGDLAGGSFSSRAYDINEAGQVVGHSQPEAFLWDSVNGMIGLGSLPGWGFDSSAYSINNSSLITGASFTLPVSGNRYQAFVWFPDYGPVYGMVSLNNLIDGSGTGWILKMALDINDAGHIVGWGINPQGDSEAFLLTPVPRDNDSDKDGIVDTNDNCPYQANPAQADCDNNWIGDACDYTSPCSSDTDRDSIFDENDNCLTAYNPSQSDCDGDGTGDVCDTDSLCADGDLDGDGFSPKQGDCDDRDPNSHPGNQEGPSGDQSCSDEIDNDCDNLVDVIDSQCHCGCIDYDGDGYGNPGSGCCPNPQTDCDDNDQDTNPGAAEICSDGIDNDCDGLTDLTDLPDCADVVDLDIARFRVSKSVNLGNEVKRIQLTVENPNGGGQEARPAILTGVQNGMEVYNQTRMVFDLSGNGRSRFAFPPFTPTEAGTISWTVEILDNDPDDDTATASTNVK